MTAQADELVLHDPSTIPDEPPPELLYYHRVRLRDALVNLWRHREIIYTLAERDFRAQYKQATLGVLWAVLSPVATLAIFIVIFSHVKSFGSEGLPYPLYAFVGILCWSFFASSLGTGGQSLLNNKALLAKTQFPRECFPLETMCVNGLNTVLSWIPLSLLFVIFGRAPRLAGLFVPALMLIEVVFAAGITLAVAGLIIQMRDLVQVLPIITSLGLFATPVIWPFSKIPSHAHVAGGTQVCHAATRVVQGIPHHVVHCHWVGGFYVNLQVVYGFFNPLGPVIDQARWTLLLGNSPQWTLVGVAALSATLYLFFGYRIFKRLEV
ncbi:MAG: ABC transporter permease, partial [Acidimicrobiales bacterium]|nr:ABC transporter permease [Acidimicrobiales bacterium]